LHTQVDIVMLCAWTKSGLDFIAPVIWNGNLEGTSSALMASSGVLWLAGCFVTFCASVQLIHGTTAERWMPLLWAAAGACYSASLTVTVPQQQQGEGWSALASWSCYLAASTWVAAALLWAASTWKFIAFTRRREALDIWLWGLSGLGFIGACCEPSLDNASRWVWASSAFWWCVGVASWASLFLKGGGFFTYS
ncbi:unnamed protein product, partial [Polarella glacialis]